MLKTGFESNLEIDLTINFIMSGWMTDFIIIETDLEINLLQYLN